MNISRLICPRCSRCVVDRPCPCTAPEQRALTETVRARHRKAVQRANWTRLLPDPPPRTRWVAGWWDAAHLIGTTGESLCGAVTVELGSRPVRNGVRWCEDCAQTAEATR